MTNNQPLLTGEQLLDAARKAVFGYVCRVFPGFFRPEDIDDMIQDTVTKILTAPTPYDPERGSLAGLAWTTASRVVLTRAGKMKRERRLFTSLDRLYKPDPDDSDAEFGAIDWLSELGGTDSSADGQLMADELWESFNNALKGERERKIFQMLNDDLDDGEIAERLGVSKPAAYTAICRVRKHLRNAA